MYKIETHLHTPYVSNCAKMAADQIVQCYKAAGYSAITVTDHYSFDNFGWKGIDVYSPTYQPESFFEGYRQVKAAAEPEGIQVYYGAELRFAESCNDYLLYGFPQDLLKNPREICAMGIAEFISLSRQIGALLIQAHPYRLPCVPVEPGLVDGIEITNRCPTHENYNERAARYAQEHGLLAIGGSDFHGAHTPPIGGIAADQLPQDSFALAALIRNGKFMIL